MPIAWSRPWRAPCVRGAILSHAIDPLAQMQAVPADVPVLLLVATERLYYRAQAVVDWPVEF